MIVTCPSCATRYNLDPGSLGDHGRTVRCSACGRRWLQEPPDDMPIRVDTPDEDDVLAYAPTARAERPHHPRPPQRTDAWVAWAGLVSAVVLVLAGSYFARNVIVGFWPPAAKIYATVGLPLSDGAGIHQSGLEIRNVEPSRIVEGDVTVLVVRGEIANTSSEVARVPEVRVLVRGESDEVLASWTFQPPEVRLVPNEIIRFETRHRNPPPETRGLTLRFSG